LVTLSCVGALAAAACSADSTTGSGTGKGQGSEFANAATGGSSSGTAGIASGGAGITGTGTGGTGSTMHTGMGCATADIQAARVTPTVWLVVDGSGSMSSALAGGGRGGGGGGPSRWQALRDALMTQTTGVVSQLQAAVVFGLLIYDGGSLDIGTIITTFGGGFFAGAETQARPTPARPQCVRASPWSSRRSTTSTP